VAGEQDGERMSGPVTFTGLRAWGGPLRATSLELTGGLNVLYGLNGSGKTSLLRAFECGVSGRLSKFDVVIFVGADATSPVREWLDAGMHSVGALDQWILLSMGLIDTTSQEPEPSDLELAHALIDCGLCAIRPVGTSEPAWEMWLCFTPERSPVLELELSRSEQSIQRVHDEVASLATASAIESAVRECALMPLVRSALKFVPRHDRDSCLGDPASYPAGDLLPRDGMPIPAVRLGTIREPLPVLQVMEGSGGELRVNSTHKGPEHQDIEGILRESARRNLSECELRDEATGVVSRCAREWAEAVQGAANDYFKSFLLDAPHLSLAWTSPDQWLWSEPIRWHVDGRSLAELSTAEGRWASFSAAMAAADSDGTTFVTLDEPESALHRAAEAHAARGIKTLASYERVTVLAATHSPELLNLEDVNLLQVSKSGNRTTVRGLGQVERRSLQELGLRPSDMLALVKTILLVEGHHDELVLQELIGDRLERSRTLVLPLRGGSKLKHVIESNFLFEFTDARIVVMLDNLRAAHLRNVWRSAIETADGQSPAEAIALIVDAFPGKVDNQTRSENIYIREFLSAALKLGLEQRIYPLGLDEPDIEFYLPIEFFVPKAEASWHQLKGSYESQSYDPEFRQKYRNYKDWLTKAYGADFSDAAFREACLAAPIPPDIEAVANLCEQQ
jgi:predicted ATPase